MVHSAQPDQPCSEERISGIHRWTDSLLSFKTTRPLALNYVAGQYARIALKSESQLIWRPFSFVSAPSENFLEFLAVIVSGGLFTDCLKTAVISDSIWIEHENYGFMTPDRFSGGEDLWLLATGTGIGTFISILRDQVIWRQFRNIILVHGIRNRQESVYRDELLRLQKQSSAATDCASLSLINCITGEQHYGQMREGESHSHCQNIFMRMTQAWDEGLLEAAEKISINAERSRVMLCGNPQMIEDMRKRLHQRGLMPCRRMKPGQFLTENYW